MSNENHHDPEKHNEWYWKQNHKEQYGNDNSPDGSENGKQHFDYAEVQEVMGIAHRIVLEKQFEIGEYRTMDSVNEYQRKIEQFAIYPENQAIVYLALGLASEAGEVAGKIKKVLRDDSGIFSDDAKLAILDELGDVMWYLSMLVTEMGIDMSDVLAENYYKLEFRQKRGFLRGSGDNR